MAFKFLQPIVKFIQSLGADDIFISYTRLDAHLYAPGLADKLGELGFSCFTDKLGTEPNKDLPESLKRKIRSCSMLVVVGTERAAKRETIAQEIGVFLSAGRTSIVPINFDGAVYKADWYPLVEGIAPEPEPNPDALGDGKPSDAVVSRIKKQFKYLRREERLRRVTRRSIAALVLLLILIGLASVVAWQQGVSATAAIERARVETDKANDATTRANDATAKADAETKRAEQASRDATAAQEEAERQKAEAQKQKTEAEKQKVEADRQKAEALKQKDIADRATKDAVEKTKLAEAAALRAKEAEKRAEYEQAIADARSLANNSQTLLRQRPEELPRAVSLAVDSMKKFTSVGLHGVEADTALRESIAMLPKLHEGAGKKELAADDGKSVALSPDGRHFASVESDGKLRVYTSDGRKLLKELDCQACSGIALSGGPTYSAASVGNGVVRVFDLARGVALQDIQAGGDNEHIALSPGGRYLAVTHDYGGDGDRQSTLSVFEVRGGKPVKSFDAPTPDGDAGEGAQAAPADCERLGMLINDVAFGPTGNLAVGGKYKVPQGGRTVGRVVMWPLLLKADGGTAEGELTDASFFVRDAVQQAREVMAVAPGADETTFATERAVWKRTPDRAAYEPVARLPVLPDRDYRLGVARINDVQRLAFGPDGKSLSVVRLHLNVGQDPYAMVRHDLEVWDASGHREQARSFQDKTITSLAFGADGQLVFTKDGVPGAGEPFSIFRAAGETGDEAVPVEVASGDGRAVYFSSYTGRFVAVGREEAAVRDARGGGKRVARFGATLREVKTAALSPNADLLALFGPTRQNGAPTLAVYRAEGDAFVESKLMPAGELPGWSYDNPDALSLSADGRVIAAHFSRGSRGYVRVYDLAAGRDLTTESLKSLDTLSSMTLSPAGRFVAVAQVANVASQRQIGRVLLIDLTTGNVVTLADDTVLTSFAFSRDGRHLGVGTLDGLLRVFDTERPGEEVARIQHTGGVTAVSFSDDGKYVATASSDPHANRLDEEESYPLRVWLLRPDDLIAEAEGRLKSLGRYVP